MICIEAEDDEVVNEVIITEEIDILDIVEQDDDQENEESTDSESKTESEVEITSNLQMYGLNDVKNYCASKKLPEKNINQLEKLRWSMRKYNLEKSKQSPILHKYFAKF